MIEHVRENIGKEFFFITPIIPLNSDEIEFYTICKVKIINIFNKHSAVLITEVINEDHNLTHFTEYMNEKSICYCLNKNLYPIYKKETEK